MTGGAAFSTKPIICRDGHLAGQYALECCFLAHGVNLLTGSENGNAVLYNVIADNENIGSTMDELSTCTRMASKSREYIGHTAPTCAVAAHPNKNDVIITASYDGNCIVWANNSNKNHPNEYFQ